MVIINVVWSSNYFVMKLPGSEFDSKREDR